jgi:hypothetical protein
VLDEYYRKYVELVEQSNLLTSNYPDKLAPLPKIKGIFSKGIKTIKSSSSSSSSNSLGSNPLTDDEEKQEAEL